MALRHLRPLEIGGWWHFLCRPHVGPNSSTNLDSGIRCGANLMGEAALWWFIHLVHTLTRHIELPAVVYAAQARLLVAPKPQRHQTVWTELVQQPNAPLGIAKGYELLAQELHADWRAIRFKQFFRHQGRNPVASHRLTHGSARARSGNQFVFFMDQHAVSSSCALPY